MSRHPPASPIVLTFLLVSGILLLPLLATPARAFGERAYERNQVVAGTSHFDVYVSQSVGQSFLATETYRLLNVTLRLRNTGVQPDSVNITIRPDGGGEPSPTYLAATNILVATGGTPSNINVPFAPAPTLTRGVTYWIVAAHAGALAEAYEWHHSNANVYPPGKAMLSQAGVWVDSPTPTDMYFVTYGREVATNISLALTSSAPIVPIEGLVTLTVYYNNTGTQPALRAWVNLTLPPALGYVSDTATSSTPFPDFTFEDVPNGAHPFDVIARVRIGTDPGSLMTVLATADFTAADGSPGSRRTASALLTAGLEWKQLYLVPAAGLEEGLTPTRPVGGIAEQTNLSVSQAQVVDFDLPYRLPRAFRATDLEVALYLDSRTHTPKVLDVDLSLMDWNGVSLDTVANRRTSIITNNFADYQLFAFSFASFEHTFAANQYIRFRFALVGTSDDDAILAMNSTFAGSRLELLSSTYVSAALELRDAAGPTTVWSPKDDLVVRANVTDPFTVSEIVSVRLNLTDPQGSPVAVWQAMPVLATDPSAVPSWRLFEVSVPPLLLEGTYALRATAIESNGIVDAAEATALVRAPAFTLEKTADAGNVRAGDRFRYYLWYNNTASAVASRVWLNDTLPGQVNFLSSSEARTGDFNWTWTSVGPGSYVLDIDVQVRGGATGAYFTNLATLEYADEKGHTWGPIGASVDTALRGPVLTLSLTSPASTVHSNETITYTYRITNTGDVAQDLWLNSTLPAGLAYVSDTAPSIGGSTTVTGSVVRVRLQNMAGGTTWTFTLTVRAAAALFRGDILTNAAALDFTNSAGTSMPPRVASHPVTVVSPDIRSASVSIPQPTADPGDLIMATINLRNEGNEPGTAWLNLTLDPYLEFWNASATASGSGTDIRFTFVSLPVGTRVLFLNVTVVPGAPDRRDAGIGGTLTYADGFGNLKGLILVGPDSVQVTAPRISPSLTPGIATIEAGTRFTFTIYHANAGTGVAGDVWLKLTLPVSLLYVADTSDGVRTIVGSSYTWHWSDVAPGPRSLDIQFIAKLTVVDRSSANLSFVLEYTDANGNRRNDTTALARADFAAPAFELTLTSDRVDVPAGGTYAYTVRVRNVGSTSARYLWLLDSVDERLEIVSFTSRVTATGGPDLNWTFPEVLPNQEEVVTLVVRVLGNVESRTPISNVVEAHYTNGAGDVIGYVRSTPVTIVVAVDAMPLLYIVLAGLAAGSAAVVVMYRRMNVAIEEVFLVYRDGILMYHLSRSLVQDRDEDVLSGMLTAVQEFVRDAFRYGEHRELHQLDFGDYRILIERGKMVYLAVVYSGKESTTIKKRVRSVLDHIETAYRGQLELWDGDMDKIVGARDMIRDFLFKPNTRVPKPAAQ